LLHIAWSPVKSFGGVCASADDIKGDREARAISISLLPRRTDDETVLLSAHRRSRLAGTWLAKRPLFS
jgi:hypothetical protein